MTREEAINEIKTWSIPSKNGREVLETLIPELRESEDERIRKLLVALVTVAPTFSALAFTTKDSTDCLSYLERQKEHKTAEYKSKAGEDIYHAINEAINLAIDVQRSVSLCFNGVTLNVFPESCISEIVSYYHEQVKDDVQREKPAEKKDYSGLNDPERAILRGFLAAGIRNVPVGIIKETAKDCIAHFPWPTKWSKEDENTINELCNIIASNSKNGYLGRHYAGDLIQKLKSLRPQPKQEWSEEDIEKMVNERARKSGTTKTEMQFYRQGIKDALKTIRQQRFGEILLAIKHDIANLFMNYLDEKKKCLSNGECEDIDKAFKENDWAKIVRYVDKMLKQR